MLKQTYTIIRVAALRLQLISKFSIIVLMLIISNILQASRTFSLKKNVFIIEIILKREIISIVKCCTKYNVVLIGIFERNINK